MKTGKEIKEKMAELNINSGWIKFNDGDSIHVGFDTNICDQAKIGNNTYIGNDSRISYKAIVADNVKIEDNVYIAPRVEIYSRCKIYANSILEEYVKVYAGAWIGCIKSENIDETGAIVGPLCCVPPGYVLEAGRIVGDF
jgi:acetyltransferase-like isoleucine patch superfamily enzyme